VQLFGIGGQLPPFPPWLRINDGKVFFAEIYFEVTFACCMSLSWLFRLPWSYLYFLALPSE